MIELVKIYCKLFIAKFVIHFDISKKFLIDLENVKRVPIIDRQSRLNNYLAISRYFKFLLLLEFHF